MREAKFASGKKQKPPELIVEGSSSKTAARKKGKADKS
jgi:hypothetical protein